jgi:cell wall-associated NlpC family hydrolase
MSVAAVQARIMEIQSRFPSPVVRTAVAPTSSPAPGASPDAPATGSFADVLATTRAGLRAAAGPTAGGSTGEAVVAKAKEHLGTPYLWGGESPGGFDCSGLMQWTYKQFGIDLPRVSRDQARAGREVSAAEARPGDLVFFDRPTIDHIGMYAGNGTWVVAPKTGDVVKVQAVDLSEATTIRRILPDGPAGTAAANALAARPAGPGGDAPFATLFQDAGTRHGVSPALLTAVARAESGFDAAARSPAGALGVMQLMPGTARELGVDPLKPEQAVDGAARLLASHLARFGSTELALAAYNAGPGAVQKHGGVPPYRETQAYVNKIMTELRAVTR